MDKRSKIAVLGFGVEGKAILHYLLNHDFHEITVCDQNVDLKAELPDGVSAILGPEYLDNLDQFEVIFRSPGVPFLTPQVQIAIQNGIEVSSSIKFFMDQCPCPIIGVSGTKGKGTTCSLIFEMLKKSGRKEGKDVFLGGNIGNSPLEFLDDLKGGDLVVLELSSFQLQDLAKSPRYAVLLNTTSDHLDYHVDSDEYLQAKEHLLTTQNYECVAVLNKDYEYSKYYSPLVKGKLKWVSRQEKVADGAFVADGKIYYADGGKSEHIADVADMALVGSHNLENILPAIVIAKELGTKTSDIHEVIKTFKNLPYRLELVREFKDIKFYNDSYATTPETSMAAVDSFDEPTVLIAGGYDKGADYLEWAKKILTKQSLHTVILIGAVAEKMEKALIDAETQLGEAVGSPTKIMRRKRMEDAVIDAYAESEPGSVIVLSPAAASFDMYKNYKERGNDFTSHVKKLR